MAYQNLKLTTMADRRQRKTPFTYTHTHSSTNTHTWETIYKIKSLGGQASERNAMAGNKRGENEIRRKKDNSSTDFPAFPLSRLESRYCAVVR